MKTKSAESSEKAVKKSARSRKVDKAPVILEKMQPSEDEIRELAEILYHQRISRGEHGSEIEDWLAAESYLNEA